MRLSGLEEVMASSCQDEKVILYIDYCRVRDKYHFLSKFASSVLPYHLYLIDGTEIEKNSIFNCCNLTRVTPPPEIYYQRNFRFGSFSNEEVFFAREDLENIITLYKLHIQQIYDYVDINIIKNCIKTTYLFSLLTIRLLKPKIIIIWNQFHPLSQTATIAARQSGVPVCFTEYGVLPETVNFDILGQMGESSIARHPQNFNSLPLSQKDLDNSTIALDYYFKTGINRRAQNRYGEISEKIIMLANGRPIIFYAGHNDLAAGMFPYKETSHDFHSPNFKSSTEAAQEIFRLADDNGWFVLYKPHPFYSKDKIGQLPSHVLKIEDGNINECIDAADVVCTVLSQVSYISQIRNKPTVLLGYNQMRGSGATYEAFVKNEISLQINQALKFGISSSQKQAWKEHVARLLKYYLYSFNINNDFSPITYQSADILSHKFKTMITYNIFSDFGPAGLLRSIV